MQISLDLSITDLDIPYNIMITFGATAVAYTNLLVLAIVTWQVLFVAIPVIYLAIRLQASVSNIFHNITFLVIL